MQLPLNLKRGFIFQLTSPILREYTLEGDQLFFSCESAFTRFRDLYFAVDGTWVGLPVKNYVRQVDYDVCTTVFSFGLLNTFVFGWPVH